MLEVVAAATADEACVDHVSLGRPLHSYNTRPAPSSVNVDRSTSNIDVKTFQKKNKKR